jgi:hypothetical protein
VNKEALRAFLKAKLVDGTKVIATDGAGIYRRVSDNNTIHVTVDHVAREYLRGLAHRNTLEKRLESL